MAAALVAAFSWPLPARAWHMPDHIGPCLKAEILVPDLLDTNETIGYSRDEEVRAFMDFYNAIPPFTDRKWDEVVLFFWPGRPGILFHGFQEGCYVGRSLISVERFRCAYPDITLPSPEAPT